MPVEVVLPTRMSGMKKRRRTEDIGADEGQGVHDRAVHMAFRGQMDHGVEVVLRKELLELGVIRNISFFEVIIRSVFDVFEVGQVAGIGQRIQVDDAIVRDICLRITAPHVIR